MANTWGELTPVLLFSEFRTRLRIKLMRQYTLRILIVMVLLPVTMAAKAYDFADDGIYYNIISEEDRTVEVTNRSSGYASYRGNIVIPPKATSNGITYNVITIGYEAFSSCTGLTSIELPESLTKIGGGAFRNCTGLTSIELPESVTGIGSYAFYDCPGLTSIELPEGLTEIGSNVFDGCLGLTSIEFPESLTEIGYEAFCYCTGLTSIEFPESLTKIGNYAFSDCTGLTSIELPQGVSYIGTTPFNGCENLAVIEVSEDNQNFASIDGVLFTKDCSKLLIYPQGKKGKQYIVPNGVATIAEYSFNEVSELDSIEFPGSLMEIESSAFVYSKISSVRCKSIAPPKATIKAFNDDVLKGTLYVPVGSKDEYMAVDPWRNFWTIEEVDYSGVGEVTDSDEIFVIVEGNSITVSGENIGGIEVYSVNGQCVYSGKESVIDGLAKGVYIVKVGSKTKKVIL